MKKQLLGSQKELLQVRRAAEQQLQNDLQQRQANLQRARDDTTKIIERMKEELGIPKDEVNDWAFDEKDNNYFVKKPKPKPPKKKKPEGKILNGNK